MALEGESQRKHKCTKSTSSDKEGGFLHDRKKSGLSQQQPMRIKQREDAKNSPTNSSLASSSNRGEDAREYGQKDRREDGEKQYDEEEKEEKREKKKEEEEVDDTDKNSTKSNSANDEEEENEEGREEKEEEIDDTDKKSTKSNSGNDEEEEKEEEREGKEEEENDTDRNNTKSNSGNDDEKEKHDDEEEIEEEKEEEEEEEEVNDTDKNSTKSNSANDEKEEKEEGREEKEEEIDDTDKNSTKSNSGSTNDGVINIHAHSTPCHERDLQKYHDDDTTTLSPPTKGQKNSKETVYINPVCSWGMDAGITTLIGNPFGDRCSNVSIKNQLFCTHDDCCLKVHRQCQWAWLEKFRLRQNEDRRVYCPAHNKQRGNYIRDFYWCRKADVPPDILKGLPRSDTVTNTTTPNKCDWHEIGECVMLGKDVKDKCEDSAGRCKNYFIISVRLRILRIVAFPKIHPWQNYALHTVPSICR